MSSGYDPDRVFPPGAHLRDWLEDREMSPTQAAYKMGVSRVHVERLLEDEVALTPWLARRLGELTGVPKHLWLRLQEDYDENGPS